MTGQKRDMTEQKLIWPVNMTSQYSKIILSPAIACSVQPKNIKLGQMANLEVMFHVMVFVYFTPDYPYLIFEVFVY